MHGKQICIQLNIRIVATGCAREDIQDYAEQIKLISFF